MPYVQINTNLSLNDDLLRNVQRRTAELIAALPNKKPERTMVELNAGKQLYFNLNEEPCIYVHVDLYKASTYDAKAAYCKALAEMLCEETGVAEERIYLTMGEYDNWGIGTHFAE